jgi:hypothetical protein
MNEVPLWDRIKASALSIFNFRVAMRQNSCFT